MIVEEMGSIVGRLKPCKMLVLLLSEAVKAAHAWDVTARPRGLGHFILHT